MKAAYVTAPMSIQVRDVPTPQVPDDGLLLAVRACGVCGSDLRRWREGPAEGGETLVAGHEFSGVVDAVGGNVTEYHVGDRLAVAPDVHCGACWYCERGMYNLCDDLRLVGITPGMDGGFAEYVALPGKVLANGVVHRVPDALTWEQAALAEPLSSVLAAHQAAGTTLGDTVVVMGAGPIGCLHMAVARARGARVILSEPSAPRRSMAERFGPDVVIDPSIEDPVGAVRRATDGRGADVAICANPVAVTHTQAVELVRKRGTVVLFGGLPKAAPMTSLDANRIHYGEVRVIGAFSYHPTFHALALDAIGRGLIDSDQVITRTLPIDDVDEAFRVAAGGEALKVMVTMDRSTGSGS